MNNLYETSFRITPEAQTIVDSAPIVSRTMFVRQLEVGDIIITFPDPRSLPAKIMATVEASVQGMDYNSSKLVSNKGIVGYGVGGHGLKLSTKTRFVRKVGSAILLRVIASEKQKQKATKYMESRIGTSYETSRLLTSVWNRYIPLFGLKLGAQIDESKKQEIERYKNSLICSTSISMAYLSAGVKLTDRNPLDVWPKDILLSNKVTPICRIPEN